MRVRLLAWLLCLLLWTLLYLHHVASVSSLPLLFFTQLCESLHVPDGGEHLGNWLLAGSVSLLFIPLFYLPGHLCLLPPSPLLCITPWTSRLKMKSFSTVRDTQRGSQSYMEKRRGREIELTRIRWGGIKRGESKLASNHFLICTPHSGPLRDVHRVTQRRGEGGRRQRWPGG